MKIIKHKKGQFIIFATLIIAIMIISIGTIMYSTVTYFKHERWQEYLMVIDNIELGSQRVIEISLANYTSTLNNETLTNNLNQWQINLTKAYPGFGVALTYSNITLGHSWNISGQTSFSEAKATLEIDMTSVGLKGYMFVASAFLEVDILNATINGNNLEILVAVEKEDSTPVTNLNEDNFLINKTIDESILISKLTHFYETYNGRLRIVYRILCEGLSPPEPSSILVTVFDTRGIKVIANSTVT